ncbi:hypothetical protein POTOM_060408 [Populus tomentosa]|uniref:Uncharacterized protein n=1 Tax=Populus tomentosa TaxID=118781 RepID=A0A8X7XQK8_POPTO|nr:hypothetical protein POTOM_060408 [Populus tomentosa]
MTKSKVKSSITRSSMDDFRLQSNRHTSASHTSRDQSRSCSPIHPTSPTFTPPYTKVALADFTVFSSDARVSSRRKNKSMRKKGSPAPSGHNGDFSSCSKSTPLVSDPNSKCHGVAHLSRPCPSSGDIASTSSTVPSMFCPEISLSPVGATHDPLASACVFRFFCRLVDLVVLLCCWLLSWRSSRFGGTGLWVLTCEQDPLLGKGSGGRFAHHNDTNLPFGACGQILLATAAGFARRFCPLLSVVVIVFILFCLWFPAVDWVARVVDNFRDNEACLFHRVNIMFGLLILCTAVGIAISVCCLLAPVLCYVGFFCYNISNLSPSQMLVGNLVFLLLLGLWLRFDCWNHVSCVTSSLVCLLIELFGLAIIIRIVAAGGFLLLPSACLALLLLLHAIGYYGPRGWSGAASRSYALPARVAVSWWVDKVGLLVSTPAGLFSLAVIIRVEDVDGGLILSLHSLIVPDLFLVGPDGVSCFLLFCSAIGDAFSISTSGPDMLGFFEPLMCTSLAFPVGLKWLVTQLIFFHVYCCLTELLLPLETKVMLSGPVSLVLGCWISFLRSHGQSRIPLWLLSNAALGRLIAADEVSSLLVPLLYQPLSRESMLFRFATEELCYGLEAGRVLLHAAYDIFCMGAAAVLMQSYPAGALSLLYMGAVFFGSTLLVLLLFYAECFVPGFLRWG